MTGVRFRRPTEVDHAPVADVADHWWDGRRMRHLANRLWFRHFATRSWIAETENGQLVGFLIGFISGDDPEAAVVRLVGVHPSRRRDGLGRELYRMFVDDVRSTGVRRIEALTWPGNRVSVAFHRSLGFVPDAGPGTMPLYGTPAYPDYEGPGEDRALLVLEVGEEG